MAGTPRAVYTPRRWSPMMQIGHYTCTALLDGFFKLDGGAMFGVVPRTIWESLIPPDAKNRIPLALRTLLVRGGGRCILLDTGIGDKWDAKLAQIYAVDHSEHSIERSLATIGLEPRDITDIVITHLHFDHAGGLTRPGPRPGSPPVPVFSEARVHVQRSNWEWASAPNDREKASYLGENFLPVQAAGLVELHDGPYNLVAGIDVLVSDGHTVGQQLIKISDAGNTLLYPGDLIPTSSHLKIPYIMSYDINPLVIMKEKREILTRATQEGWVVCFEHDPAIGACTVELTEKGFARKTLVDLTPAEQAPANMPAGPVASIQTRSGGTGGGGR